MKGEGMFKITILLVKYAKLAVLTEMLANVKNNLAQCQLRIDEDDSDMLKNYWGGQIRAYQNMSDIIMTRIRAVKEDIHAV